MAIYYVTTNALLVGGKLKSRTLVIEADHFVQSGVRGAYEFFNNAASGEPKILVASVPENDVFAITEEEALQGDWIDGIYDGDDEDPEGEDDICLDCRFDELLDSDRFGEAVWNIINVWHEPDEDTPPEAEPPAEANPIEHWKSSRGDEWWGIQTSEGFVHFPTKRSARENLHYVLENPKNWSYLDLEGYTKVED